MGHCITTAKSLDPVIVAEPSDAWLRTHCYVCSEPVTDPTHQGMTAKCPRCRLYLGGGADCLDVAKIRRREIAEARVEPTPEDWQEFAAWSEAMDQAWLADQAERRAALDAPNSATVVDWDLLYADRATAEYPASLGIGHPATED